MSARSEPEFSRLIAIEGIIPDKVRKESVEATADECTALAERMGVRKIESLKADLNIRRVAGGTAIQVDGTIDAEIVQACVVSLRDVHDHIKEHFETFFTEDRPADAEDELEFNVDDDDPPEMVHNGMIDLGEVVAQYLSLELDPYPRAPGVNLAAQMVEAGSEVKNRPFSVLQSLQGDGRVEKVKK